MPILVNYAIPASKQEPVEYLGVLVNNDTPIVGVFNLRCALKDLPKDAFNAKTVVASNRDDVIDQLLNKLTPQEQEIHLFPCYTKLTQDHQEFISQALQEGSKYKAISINRLQILTQDQLMALLSQSGQSLFAQKAAAPSDNKSEPARGPAPT